MRQRFRSPIDGMRRTATVLCLAVPASVALADSPEAGNALAYHYFKQRIELPVDVTRIAFRAPGDGNPLDVGALAQRLGVSAKDIAPFPITPWFTLGLPAGQRDAESAMRLALRAAEDPRLDFASPILLGTDGGPLIVTPVLLVGFADQVSDARAEALLADAGTILDRHWTGMRGVYRVHSPLRSGAEVLARANALALLPEIAFAEPDMIFTGRGDFIPNDPLFTSLWGLHNTGQFGGVADMDMDVPEAWDITMGDPSILVVVLDTGVQQDHPDINQVPGADFTGQGGGGGPMNSCDVHGTAVAGCVSAIADNAIGVAGVAPACKVASARPFVSNVPCNGTWNSVASMTVDALAWAESIGARVTNNSNYYGFTSGAISTKYSQTWSLGMVHFASAGNNAAPAISYPASIPVVNSVAALSPNGARASFSNWGTNLDFSAPGESIYTTDLTGAAGYTGGDYVLIDGTSFSSPYAAGVAALVIAWRPSLSAAEVETSMQASCVDLGAPGYDLDFGWGFLNAREAILALLDCNANGIDDNCDLDCDLPDCAVPGCGEKPDCNANSRPDDCDISLAISTDCNANAVPDECDLAGGSSLDCNASAVPDECELPDNDCDSNAIPDDCDMAVLAATVVAPDDVLVCAGESASFSVTADGATSYQWYRDGVTPLVNGGAIFGADGPTLVIDPVTESDDGAMVHCLVSAGCISAASSAALLEVPADDLDVHLTSAPVFSGCAAGGVLVVQVSASDARTAVYQWSKDGIDLADDGRISGAQTRTLQINSPTGADNGAYTCTVGNMCTLPGGEVSTTGLVQFVDPFFTQSPQNACAEIGESAVFHAEADGLAPFIYRWYEGAILLSDGAKFSGTTTDTLTVANIAPGDNGRQFRLRAIVTSPFCSTYSSSATLSALPAGQCPNCPFAIGDMDGDGDFDLRDMQAFNLCFGVNAAIDTACACANVDFASSLIDLDDWQALADLIAGPG